MSNSYSEIKIIKMSVKSSYQKTIIPVYKFYCTDKSPVGVVQLVHGLTENCEVYVEMGKYFAQNGFVFIVHDVLGHGKALIDNIPMFLPNGGWQYAVRDIEEVYNQATSLDERKLRRSIIGFSMGSFLVRSLLSFNKIPVDNVFLVGTGNKSNIEIGIGEFITSSIIKCQGDIYQSKCINNLAMNSNNKYFKDTYENAWLYKDTTCAKKYTNNPACFKYTTPSFFRELLRGMRQSKETGYLSEFNPNLILLSGENDVVTKDIMQLANFFHRKGCEKVFTYEIPEYRHAILSDACRFDVWSKIINFINGNYLL